MTNTMKKKNDGRFVFLCFLGFFGTIAAVDFYFVTTALKTHTGVITDRAYERGLDYNNTLKQAEAQKSLGFTDKISYTNNLLSWEIDDQNNTPLSGLNVKATLIREVQKGKDFTLDLKEISKGIYQSEVNSPLKGQWLVVVETQWNNKPYRNSSKIFLE